MTELARRGKGVIFISSEFTELVGACNRVLVMRESRLVGEFEGDADHGRGARRVLLQPLGTGGAPERSMEAGPRGPESAVKANRPTGRSGGPRGEQEEGHAR